MVLHAGEAGARVSAAVGGVRVPRGRGGSGGEGSGGGVCARGEEGGEGADPGRALESLLLPNAVLYAVLDVSAESGPETGRRLAEEWPGRGQGIGKGRERERDGEWNRDWDCL